MTSRPTEPYRLNEETHRQLVAAATGGATNRDAARMVGIDEGTLYNWLGDQNPGQALAEFQDAYTKAQAAGRFRLLQVIRTSDDWRASAWLLERMDPTHWGKTEIDVAQLEQKLAAYLTGHNDAQTDEPDKRLPEITAGE